MPTGFMSPGLPSERRRMRAAIRARASRSRSPANIALQTKTGATGSRPNRTGPFMSPQMIAKTGEKPQMRRDIFRFGKILPCFELSRLP